MSILSAIAPYAAGTMLALAVFGGVQTWRIGRLKYEANVAAGEIKALGDAKDLSERLRDKEGKGADLSYQGLADACAARIPITITAGRTLERIVNAPANPDGSRGLCDADCVRGLVGQAKPVRESGAMPQ